MNSLERARNLLEDAEDLNTAVRAELDDMPLSQARELRSLVNEVKGWMLGIDKLLEI